VNASEVDLTEGSSSAGFIEIGLTLPNGTIGIGDKCKACTKVLKDDTLVCNEGFNWPGNRPEVQANYVMLP
jgi:hypothetical protein